MEDQKTINLLDNIWNKRSKNWVEINNDARGRNFIKSGFSFTNIHESQDSRGSEIVSV